MLRRYFFYGILGWITEVLWTGFGSLLKGNYSLRSQTYLWMFFIYGLAVFLEPIHEVLRMYKWWVRGIIYMGLIFTVEYFTGYLLDAIIGKCPWDYSDKSFSFNGYIRLDYAPVWFATGLVFEYIHDKINNLKLIS